MEERIKLEVSACLLRQNVRYNLGYNWDPFISDTFPEIKIHEICGITLADLEVYWK